MSSFPFPPPPPPPPPVTISPESLSHLSSTMTRRVLVYGIFYVQIMLTLVTESVDADEYYPDERDALIQFRDVMRSNSNIHGNWTGPPCYRNQSHWAGIGCENWHVTRLVLEGVQLTGSLPLTFLHNITYLNKLSLSNNSISGNLPDLTSLVHLEYLFLPRNNFSGSIPLHYTDLPKLKSIELQENGLTGGIPPFDQKYLTDFNVSYNHLSGSIPETSVLERFPESSYDHNSGLCGRHWGIPCPFPPPFLPNSTAPSPGRAPAKENGRLKVWNIVLIAVAAAVIPISVMLIFLCYYRNFYGKETKPENLAGTESKEGTEKKTHWSESTDDPERTVELEFFDKDRVVFDLDDLLRASAEVLGKGKMGTTYKAMLETGPGVAVKRVKEMNSLSKKEFVQQMQLLGKLRHQNLVEIISFYYSKEEKLVISEFVPHGSLFELLHENRGMGRVTLDWSTRVSIMKDVANGLIFLHQSLSSQKVPHGNLKSSNILIQRDGFYHSYAKLSDFGYLPLLPSRKSSEKLAIAKCPEFVQGKKLTYKADIYCFGILLLEVITGKIPGEMSGDNSYDDLSDWVTDVMNSDWTMDIVDMEILAEKEGHDEMLRLTELALECTDRVPEKRPKMSQVLIRLEEIPPQASQ